MLRRAAIIGCLFTAVSMSTSHGGDNVQNDNLTDTKLAGAYDCNNDGTLTIVEVKPPLSTIIDPTKRYDFEMTVKYTSPSSGRMVTAVCEMGTSILLDNQQSCSNEFAKKKGIITVSTQADITVNGNPASSISSAVSLFPTGIYCTSIAKKVIYFTSRQSYLTAEPLNLDYNSTNLRTGLCGANTDSKDKHLGRDILAPAGTPVYAVCDGVVYANLTKDDKGSDLKNYSESVLIIKHTCGNGMNFFGYYGNITSRLSEGDYVQYNIPGNGYFPAPLGQVREAYSRDSNGGPVRSPESDHLHLGLNLFPHDEAPMPWDYIKGSESCDSIRDSGWVDPKEFFGW